MAVGALVGGFVNAGINIAVQADNGNISWKQVGVAALSGAASGALTGSGIGFFGAIAGNALIGGGSYMASQWAGGDSVTRAGLFVNTGAGELAGLIGGPGAFKDIGPALQNMHLQAINAAYVQAKSGAFGVAVNRFTNTVAKATVVNTTKSIITDYASNYTGVISDWVSSDTAYPNTDFGYRVGFC